MLEIYIDDLNKVHGIDTILVRLDKLYLRDKLQLAYLAYDKFEKFERSNEMPTS